MCVEILLKKAWSEGVFVVQMCGIYLGIGTDNLFFKENIQHVNKGIDIQMAAVGAHAF